MTDDRAKLLQSLTIARDAPPPSRRRGRLVPALVSAFAILALGAGVMLWFAPDALRGRAERAEPSPGEQAAAPAPAVSDPAPSAGADRGGLSASGYVVARRKATVAAEITGKVVATMIEEGMVVEAGQVVAKLDSVLAETDLALSQSRVAAAEAARDAIAADLADAERIYQRAHTLSQKSFASEADVSKAEARLGVLRAQLAQARAQHETARLDARRNAAVLDKHSIRAPFGGVVIERSAQPGEMISPLSAGGGFTRTGVCTIVDMDSIEVEVDVNESFIGRVRAGGAVNAVLDAYPDWTISASVIAIVPAANRDKATVRVRIAFKQKDPRILPDMAVKVRFLDDGAAAGVASAGVSALR